MGTFKKAGTTPKKHLVEFKFDEEYNLGDVITVDIFANAEYVDIVGTSKGKVSRVLLSVMDSVV